MGLFDKPFASKKYVKDFGSKKHRKIAREAVRKSMVLLKNDNNILPLSKNLDKIHVAGIGANDIGMQCGGWTIEWQGKMGDITSGTSILDGIKSTVSKNTEVTFSETGNNASNADVGIVVIGEKPYAEGMGDDGELKLSKEDIAVLNNMKSANIPLVVIMLSGRPLMITEELKDWDAFISAWLPGTEGNGVADVIFGDYNPTGKLSFSWPRDISQIPANYKDKNYDPLFEFSYGLKY